MRSPPTRSWPACAARWPPIATPVNGGGCSATAWSRTSGGRLRRERTRRFTNGLSDPLHETHLEAVREGGMARECADAVFELAAELGREVEREAVLALLVVAVALEGVSRGRVRRLQLAQRRGEDQLHGDVVGREIVEL